MLKYSVTSTVWNSFRYGTKFTTVTGVHVWVNISKPLKTRRLRCCPVSQCLGLRRTDPSHRHLCLLNIHSKENQLCSRCALCTFCNKHDPRSQSKCTAAKLHNLIPWQPSRAISEQLLSGPRWAPQSALSSPFWLHPRLMAATTMLYMLSQAWRSGPV